MSAPLIWIVLPGLAAGGLYFWRRNEKASATAGTLVALGLAWAAWQVPINAVIELGPWSFKIGPSLELLGRQLVLDNTNRPILTLIYLAAAYWLGGSLVARAGRLLPPVGLGVMALMVAALAVEPFLYAALMIELAALLCALLLVEPGRPVGRGVLRFITFQTLGTPFILFSGWMLTGIENNPLDPDPALRAALLLGLGFAFMLAVFPFHTWLPMLGEEAHPYAAGFVFFMLPGMVSLFGLDFIGRYNWLANSPALYELIRSAGLLMMVTGGVWAAFQRHLGRMLGYAVTMDLGLSLVAISLQPRLQVVAGEPLSPLAIFSALFVARGAALALWALALSVLRQESIQLQYRDVQGLGRRLPLTAGSLVLAQFALAGFPLLASFPARLQIGEALSLVSPLSAFWMLVASIGLLAGGVRTLAVLVMGPDESPWQFTEKRIQWLFLGLGGLALLLIGYMG